MPKAMTPERLEALQAASRKKYGFMILIQKKKRNAVENKKKDSKDEFYKKVEKIKATAARINEFLNRIDS